MSSGPGAGFTRRTLFKAAGAVSLTTISPASSAGVPTQDSGLSVAEARAAACITRAELEYGLTSYFGAHDLIDLLTSGPAKPFRPTLLDCGSDDRGYPPEDYYVEQFRELNACLATIEELRFDNVKPSDITEKVFDLLESIDEEGLFDYSTKKSIIANLRSLDHLSNGDLDQMARLFFGKTKPLVERIVRFRPDQIKMDLSHELWDFAEHVANFEIGDEALIEATKAFARDPRNQQGSDAKLVKTNAAPEHLHRSCGPDIDEAGSSALVTPEGVTKTGHRFGIVAASAALHKSICVFDVQRVTHSINPHARVAAAANGGRPGLVVAVSDPAIVDFFYACAQGRKAFPLRPVLVAPPNRLDCNPARGA